MDAQRRLPLRLVKSSPRRIVGGRFGKDGVTVECLAVGVDEECAPGHSVKAMVPQPATAGVFFVGYGESDLAAAEDLFFKVKAAEIVAHKRSPKSAVQAAHKRSVRGATTATLDASNLATGGVLVLCVGDVLTKNDRYVRTKHGTAESSLSKAYKAAVARAALSAGFVAPIKVAASKLLKTKAGAIYGDKTITAGVWSLEVLSIWPTQRHLKDAAADLANGDSDAPLSMVRDAMQRAGIIDDDMRIVSDRTFSLYIKDERRTVARLRRMNNAEGMFRRGLIDDLLRDEEWARRPGSAVLG